MNLAEDAINRALESESWAREKLAAHGGRTLRLVVGPLRIEVRKPLRTLRLVCEPDPEHPAGLSFDLVWKAEFPALWDTEYRREAVKRFLNRNK